MTRELQHTPGPVIRRGHTIICRHSRLAKGEHDFTGRQIAVISGLGIVNTDIQTATARLFAAGYNDFDSAAQRLRINAVQLAEAMQDGGIATMLRALEDLLGDRPDMQGGICQHCGMDYIDDFLEGACQGDDCPANRARALIVKTRHKQTEVAG
jgi:hypothetical protein